MSDPNLELQESGWEELRREARKIEGDLDVKLSSYAKLGARFTTQGGGYVESGSPTVGSSRSWKSMEMEIESSLEKLLDINDAMSRCAAASAATSVTQKLARHRDILHEFTQEFRRIKGNINSMKEHAELLSSVRDDINEFKASGSMSPRVKLLRERAAIHGSIAHIDDVINQAQTTRAALGSQRTIFGDVQGKVKLLSDKFPIVRGLLDECGGESGENEGKTNGVNSAEVCKEEERIYEEDDRNEDDKREGESNRVGRHAGHPTMRVMLVGRVGDNVDPTTRTRPSGSADGAAKNADPTARTMPYGETDGNTMNADSSMRMLPSGDKVLLHRQVHMEQSPKKLEINGDFPRDRSKPDMVGPTVSTHKVLSRLTDGPAQSRNASQLQKPQVGSQTLKSLSNCEKGQA
ncbi:hypothetical protein SADUNF_Sadunf02G0121900 [Salix dunnii]|uniref:Golgi SNAP receptor complex member 1 n=1 Tax=Salix dunnii TaxID=1413687 RepID=A0A835N7H9_9ROSI|nr:hypothetical protein SADUNF_Sadunf02G0121900 [Salix dunnii]